MLICLLYKNMRWY